jgi:ABC-2 type transport system permease protein
MMTVACIVLPGAALVREKERGTIEQPLVSLLAPFQVMFAKVLAMMFVTVAGTAVALLAVMHPIFGVPIRGSLPLFLLLTALYAFTNAGLGLVSATSARNSGQLGMIVLLLVTPIIMLSGTWVTLKSMPPALRAATLLSPLRHFIDIAYGILLRGSGWGALARPVAAMTGLGIALFGTGLWRFRGQTR